MAAQAGLEAARQANDLVMEGESLLQLGQIAAGQGQFETALEHLQAAQKILKKTGRLRREAQSLNKLGAVNSRLNDYAQAESHCQQALAMNQVLGDRRGETACLNNLGILRLDSGDYTGAITHFRQVLEINRIIGHQQGEAKSLNNLAATYRELGHLKMAQNCIEKARAIHYTIDDRPGEADDLRVLGAIHLARGNYMAARDCAGEALEICQHQGVRAQEGQTWLGLGLALEALDDFDKASVAYSQTQTIQQEVGNKAGSLEARAGLARCLLANGNTNEAQKEVETYLAEAKSQGMAGAKYPIRLYLTAYWVLQAANKKEEAIATLQQGHTFLQKRVDNIEDAELRRLFKEKSPENKEFWTQLRLHTDKDTVS